MNGIGRDRRGRLHWLAVRVCRRLGEAELKRGRGLSSPRLRLLNRLLTRHATALMSREGSVFAVEFCRCLRYNT